jgi:hypothetical protein
VVSQVFYSSPFPLIVNSLLFIHSSGYVHSSVWQIYIYIYIYVYAVVLCSVGESVLESSATRPASSSLYCNIKYKMIVLLNNRTWNAVSLVPTLFPKENEAIEHMVVKLWLSCDLIAAS